MTSNQSAMAAVDDFEKTESEGRVSQRGIATEEVQEKPQQPAPVQPVQTAATPNVIPHPGIGHNQPPAHVGQAAAQRERIKRAGEIHRETQELSTVQLEQEIAEDQAMIKRLHTQIGHQETVAQEAIENEENTYDLQRQMLEGDLREARARRDEQMQAFNREIEQIQGQLTVAKEEHEISKGKIVRHHQAQIESLRERIARRERALGEK